MPRSREHHFSLPRFHVDHNKNLKLMYSLRICRDLMNKLTLFFLPIFLFELGSETDLFSFLSLGTFQSGMLAIGIYYTISGLFGIFSSIWAGQITSRIGYQKTFLISYLLRLFQFVLLFYLRSVPQMELFAFAVLLNGLQSPLFWGGYWTILSKNAKRAHMGQDMGVQQLLLQLVGVVSPAISGFVAYLLGIEILFLFGIIITLISAIITLTMEEHAVKYKISWKEFFNWMSERRYERLAVSLIGKYIYDAAVYIWPLYIFILLGTIDKVGYLYTISLFLAMLVTFFASVYIDSSKSKQPFYFSGGVLSIVWLARTQIVTIWGIVLSDVFDRLAANVHTLFFDTAVIKRGKGSKAFAYFMYREVLINTAAVLFWISFTAFFLLNGGWTGMFVFASIGAMLSLLVRDTKVNRLI